MAQLSPSVPQEVKNSCSASQPRASATVRRQSSTCFFVSSPMGYWELGLPNCSVSTVYMVSATARGTGRGGCVVQIDHGDKPPAVGDLPNGENTRIIDVSIHYIRIFGKRKEITMKVAIYTLGCKVNQYETQAMEQDLRARGHEVVPFTEEADAYVVNSCSVTAVSDQKSRQMLHRVRRQHPDAVAALCGCYPQTHAEDVRTLDVDLIAGTGDRIGLCGAAGGGGGGKAAASRPSTSPLSGGSLRCCPPAAWRSGPGPC